MEKRVPQKGTETPGPILEKRRNAEPRRFNQKRTGVFERSKITTSKKFMGLSRAGANFWTTSSSRKALGVCPCKVGRGKLKSGITTKKNRHVGRGEEKGTAWGKKTPRIGARQGKKLPMGR